MTINKRLRAQILAALLGLGGGTALALVASLMTSGPQGTGADVPRGGPADSPTGSPAAGPSAPALGFAGVLIPAERVDLSTEWGGRLLSIEGRMGDQVRAGQVIARMDPELPGQEVQAASAALALARTDAKQAHLDLEQARALVDRLRPLVEKGFAPREELASALAVQDKTAAAVGGATARVQRESATANASRLRAQGFEVRTPFDAVVALHLSRPGQVLKQGDPIVRLIRNGAWRVRFAVPEGLASDVRPGGDVLIRTTKDSPPIKARVDAVSPEVEPAAGVILAEAEVGPLAEAQAMRAAGAVRVFLPADQSPSPFDPPVRQRSP